MKSLMALMIAALLAAPAWAHDPDALTTVILVRHAEKGGEAAATDPGLSEAGMERATELARVLEAATLTAVYTTPYERTRQTAAPVAAAKMLTPVEVKPGSTYAADIVARIAAEHGGETVLVVGHSNTTQQVIRELGIENAPSIAESEYDNLFIVTIGGEGARLVTLRYGAATR